MSITSFKPGLSCFRVCLIIGLLGLSLHHLCAFQQSTPRKKTKYEFTDTRISEADTLLKKRKYEAALAAYQKAYDTYQAEEFYEGMVYAKERVGRTYRGLKKDSLSRVSYETAGALSREWLGPNHILESKAYLNNGIRAHRKEKYLIASQLIDSARASYSQELYDSGMYRQIVDYKFYTYLYSNQEADTMIKYLNERGRLLEVKKSSINTQVFLLSDYSRAYYQIGDYQKAVAYALEGVKLAEELINKITPFYYTDALFNLGRSLNFQRELEKALSVSNKLIEYTLLEDPSSTFLLGYYNLKAVVLNGLERYSEASIEFERIIQAMERGDLNTVFYRSSLMNLGVCYQLMGSYDVAETYLIRALNEEKRRQNPLDIILSDRYEYLGQLYMAMNKHDLALSYYDSALRTNSKEKEFDQLSFPDSKNFSSTYEVLNILKNKQMNMSKLDSNSNWPQAQLLESVINHTDSIHLYLMNNRGNLEASKGKLFLSGTFKGIYESGLDAAHKLFAKDPTNEDCFWKAFSFFGYSKSILFLEQSGELGMIRDERLPDALRNKYFDIKREVDKLEEAFNVLIEDVANNDSLRIINSVLLNKSSQLKSMSDSISRLLGFDLLDQEGLESLKDKTKSGTAVIEYFVGEEYIFIIGVSGKKHLFEKTPLDSVFYNSFEKLVSSLSKRPSMDSYDDSLSEFQDSAHLLFNTLLRPALAVFGNKLNHINLIPDEQLSKLPFEALVTSKKTNIQSFRELDYLARSLSVSYHLSSTEFVKDRALRKVSKGVLGIGYSGNLEAAERFTAFGTLPGTEKEIEFLKSRMEGDYYLGEEGSREKFLQEARNYDILHLAIHGEADSLDRYQSNLIFNGSENHILKTSDLYVADLNARLAVLSACESGSGQINKGEGTFSIARGFALVGVPSIVMSLWKVTDDLSTEVMMDFYDGLYDGQSVASALRNAKLAFLSNSDNITSHPFFWANYVALGADQTIELKSARSPVWHWLVGLLCLSILAFFISQKRNFALLKR